MSMGRRKMHGWPEYDAYTRWRKVLCYMQNHSPRKKIKRVTHKRERRDIRRSLRLGKEE